MAAGVSVQRTASRSRPRVGRERRRAAPRRIGAWVALLCVAACDPYGPAPVLPLPPRPAEALTGSEIAREIRDWDLDAREDRLYEEVARGNVPSWLRELRPVEVTGRVDGRDHRVTLWVTPDYLSVGSDRDHLLVPLSPQVAQRIADLLESSLPTPPIVDAIWSSADSRLTPQRIQPQDSVQSVRTVEFVERHNALIRAQRQLRGVAPDALVAGHKKDVVLSATLAANPGKVAVYGWHGPDGRPNQELSTVADDERVYYHHGVRLVHRRVLLDGIERDLAELLSDPSLAPILSRQGPIEPPRYPLSRGG